MTQRYYFCHYPSQTAMSLVDAIPNVVLNSITGLESKAPNEVLTLGRWGHPDYGFVPEQDIGNYEISQESIERCRLGAIELAKISLREQRDKLLDEIDRTKIVIDRWVKMTPEKQQQWIDYKEALRNLPDTVQDWFNPVWPAMPE